MVQLAILSAARLGRMGHGTEDVSREVRNSGRSVGNILALLQLDLVAVLNQLLSGILLGAFGIFEDGPKVGDPKNNVGADKCLLQ